MNGIKNRIKKFSRYGRIFAAGLLGLFVAVVFTGNANAYVWSSIGAGCVPDDGTKPSKYDTTTGTVFVGTEGGVKFQGDVTGDIYFVCNIQADSDIPSVLGDVFRMYVSYKDTGPNSSVQVSLIGKSFSDGRAFVVGTFYSTDDTYHTFPVLGHVDLPGGLDFSRNAYFVRVKLNRTVTTEYPEFHIVAFVWVLL